MRKKMFQIKCSQLLAFNKVEGGSSKIVAIKSLKIIFITLFYFDYKD